ncbi:hypothetical protein P7D52_02395 [Enterococcus dongliensis]|uniref:Uncharacterized protein n=1 Tax=Enterococcus dongliensis TaxID=2559925 RepID=A0AAP5KP06_9ENTE|nr:hypothetical protein [Enterococcus dongliensis]MDT2595429.1 hypothetical protein [Enterococcus dongliensis]MDT2603357.1 hypothetical protein [Enterococcus dongliensis]MDT2633718.1 hypothetical protein [Enterococcus dongliensis]MDT2635908.1 hypothetical protein [Enterococcus dongliensis]MDT2639818.1 hypothetical protein [Enterococcus dongliensis]
MMSAAADFDYYERTIRTMYQNYYWKRIVISGIALAIIMGYSGIFQDNLVLNFLLMVVLIGILIFLFLEKQKFSEVYQAFLRENQPQIQIHKIQEEEYSYNVMDDKKIRINKKGVRNLPSNNKQYTLMVGFSKAFFTREPLQIIYYDILDLTYEEKFRLRRNGYTKMPRFLRRFTLRNLQASVGNGLRFVLGNIFLLFILYRLLRYLWSFLRIFF